MLHVVSSLRTLYGVAMAEGWVNAPANLLRHDGVLAEMPEPDDADSVRLSLATVQALITSPMVPLERRARYALAFTSGLRDGEIAGVRLCVLVLDGMPPTVKIEEAVALVGAKGPKAFAKAKAPKTKASKRTLPVHRAAVAAIREWLDAGYAMLVGRQPGPTDYLFPRPDGQPSRPRSAEFIRDDLKAAGLPDVCDGKPVEFKATRSTFATWLDEAGVDERVRKRLMGHVATDVTEKHYTARELATLAVAVETIDLAWGVVATSSIDCAAVDVCDPGTVPSTVSTGTVIAESSMIPSAPGKNRTCDLRFRNPLHLVASVDIRGNTQMGDPPALHSATANPAIPGEQDASRTLQLDAPASAPMSPRTMLLAALSAALPACIAAGDLEAARVATDAIGRLLGVSGSTGSGTVIELASHRRT